MLLSADLNQKTLAGISRLLSPHELSELFEQMTPIKLEKGHRLLSPGEVCNQLNFVVSGGLKMIHESAEGKEKVVDLFCPGQFAVNFVSFISRSPSDVALVTTKPSHLYVLTYSHLQTLFREKPLFERISRLLTEAAYLRTIDRFRSLLTKDSVEAYEHTILSRPELFEHFPLYVISSYLAVSPEWLSRIRRKTGKIGNY